ncbi:MAG: DUF1028 domain-containing protein [Candidatus Aminicenantes bacterium]|jgi:hypothetical protein
MHDNLSGSSLTSRTVTFVLLLSLTVVIGLLPTPVQAKTGKKPKETSVATFSIVACDAASGEIGVAVALPFFAVGHVVPWAKAGVGAVATQSFMNTSFGWRGLELLEMGLTPEEIVKVLTRNDDNPEQRQLGIVSADGKSATYTGKKCLAWTGGRN